MIRIAAALWLAVIPVSAPVAAAPVAFQCHVALVLALDASESVDPVEADLQRRGVSAALRDPEVRSALVPSRGYGAFLTAFEWSDPGEIRVLADWAALDGPVAIDALAARIEAWPSDRGDGQTGIGAALAYAARAFLRTPVRCDRRVIDISGDGPGNIGPAPSGFRDRGVFDGVTINGLVIRDVKADYALQQPTRDPLPYYEREVRHGAGSFVIVTPNYRTYAAAIREKLLRELRPTIANRGANSDANSDAGG